MSCKSSLHPLPPSSSSSSCHDHVPLFPSLPSSSSPRGVLCRYRSIVIGEVWSLVIARVGETTLLHSFGDDDDDDDDGEFTISIRFDLEYIKFVSDSWLIKIRIDDPFLRGKRPRDWFVKTIGRLLIAAIVVGAYFPRRRRRVRGRRLA